MAGGRKSGLSFAKFLCGLVVLAVPLCTSCGQKNVDVQKVLGKENYKVRNLMVAVPGAELFYSCNRSYTGAL